MMIIFLGILTFAIFLACIMCVACMLFGSGRGDDDSDF